MSVRALFHKRGITNEVVSLRDCLLTHRALLKQRPFSLKEAAVRLRELNDGKGFARGCRHPDEIQLQFAGKHNLAHIIPAWVAADDEETRTVEGILVQSNITHTDFPFRPWHTFYDWNFHLRVDDQYRYLVSKNHHKKTPPMTLDGERLRPNTQMEELSELFECEWDTGFLPDFAWPQDGDRVWITGRWIYDCGHPEGGLHRAEIHPPKALVSFRSEAVTLDGNQGPTRANNAVVYIGRNGGYWTQPINDQDYVFDLYLPPRPSSTASVATRVERKTDGPLPVQPILTPVPTRDPRLIRVRIPLKGVTPHPDEYGVVISGGWNDPDGSASKRIRNAVVTIRRLAKHKQLDKVRDEWHVYVGINGRWKRQRLEGPNQNVGLTLALALHSTDRIHVTACGFEADTVHSTMGADSGVSGVRIGQPIPTDEAVEIAKAIRNTGAKTGSKHNQNEPLELLSKFHEPVERGSFAERSFPDGKYTLHYTIE